MAENSGCEQTRGAAPRGAGVPPALRRSNARRTLLFPLVAQRTSAITGHDKRDRPPGTNHNHFYFFAQRTVLLPELMARNNFTDIGRAAAGKQCPQPNAKRARPDIGVATWQLAREKQLALTRQIDYKSTLTTNLWTPLIDCVRATNQTTRICDKIAVGSPQRFYRVAFTNCTPAP